MKRFDPTSHPLLLSVAVLGLLGTGFARARAFSRATGASLTPTFGRLAAGAVDTADDYAYFVAPTRPGALLRIRLSDFTRAGELFLGPDEIDSGFLALDPLGRFAYTDANINPGRLVKISLNTFQRVGALSLATGKWPDAAALDPARGWLWTTAVNANQRLTKVRLSDFREASPVLEIPAGNSLDTIAYDTATGVGYFVETGAAPRLVQADFLTMTRLAELPLAVDEVFPKAIVLDRARGFLYLSGTGSNDNRVLRVRLNPLERVDVLALPQAGGNVTGGVLDPNGTFAYFAVNAGGRGHIDRVDLGAFVSSGVLSTAAGEQARALTLDPRSRTIYFVCRDQPAAVTKVDLASFARGPTLSYDWGESFPGAIFKDAGGFAYFGTDTVPAKAVRVQMSNLAVSTRALPSPAGFNLGMKTGFADPNGLFVYFVSHGLPTRIHRVRTSDFGWDQSLDLSNAMSDPNLVWSSAVDPGTRRAFIASSGASPPRIGVIGLNGFSLESTLTLPTEFNAMRAGAADGANGFVYFAAGNALARIHAASLSVTTAAVRSPSGFPATALAVDGAGFAYYGGGQTITKVRLSDFTEVDRITHPGLSPQSIESLAVDAGNNAGYAGTYGSPAVVLKFHLSPLEWADAAGMKPPESWLSSVVIDTATQKAFFTDHGARAGIVKINLSVPAAAPAVPGGPVVSLATSRTLRVRCDDVSDAERFEFYASTDSGAAPAFGATMSDSETTIGVLTGLSPRTTYFLHARACNSIGCSGYTAFGPASTTAGAPAGGQILSAQLRALAAQWTPAVGAGLYTLAASTRPAPPGSTAPTAPVVVTSGSVQGLTLNTRYYLFVNSCESGACSDWTALGSSATLANPPAELTVKGVGPGAVRFHLGSNGNPAGTVYVLERAPAAAGPFAPVLRTTALDPTVTGLSDRTAYAFRARAENLDGVPTAYTAAALATTEAGPPRAFPNPAGALGNLMTLAGFRPDASVHVFRLNGERVRALTADATGAALWDLTSANGDPLASGVYLVVGPAANGERRLVKAAIQR
ncbi:MAG: hypothetical protein IPP68_02055 [Elusimicrobia bacterium]|nr:hypothetical protein [Elusimicrobiota bacterium]